METREVGCIRQGQCDWGDDKEFVSPAGYGVPETCTSMTTDLLGRDRDVDRGGSRSREWLCGGSFPESLMKRWCTSTSKLSPTPGLRKGGVPRPRSSLDDVQDPG